MHRIVKEIELDYGHTLPAHMGYCNQIHGHRAIVEAAVSGLIDLTDGAPSQGMVIDFGELKRVMMEKVHAVLDHGFAVWEKDETVSVIHDWVDAPLPAGLTSFIDNRSRVSTLAFIKARNKKVLVTKQPPTAEYLAQWAYEQIATELQALAATFKIPKVNLDYVCWHETPTSWAKYPV